MDSDSNSILNDLLMIIQKVIAGFSSISKCESNDIIEYKISSAKNQPTVFLVYENITKKKAKHSESISIDVSHDVNDSPKPTFGNEEIKKEKLEIEESHNPSLIKRKKVSTINRDTEDNSMIKKNLMDEQTVETGDKDTNSNIHKKKGVKNTMISILKRNGNGGSVSSIFNEDDEISNKVITYNRYNTKKLKTYRAKGKSYLNESDEEGSNPFIPIIEMHLCKYCGESFENDTKKEEHEETHSEVKPYACSYCEDKTFKYLNQKLNHELIHTGKKRFKCDYCDKTFCTKSNKLKHHKIHTGQKRYRCERCHKYFNDLASKESHDKMHADGKLFNCDYCEKTFDHSEKKKSHETFYHLCKYCDKTFANLKRKTWHENLHVGVVPKLFYTEASF